MFQGIFRAANPISGEMTEQVFRKAKQWSSACLCILLPWMHWRVPSSALIVKVSPGLTWTKKTCRKKNKHLFHCDLQKLEFPWNSNYAIPFLEEMGRQGGNRPAYYTRGYRTRWRFETHLHLKSWNEEVTQLHTGENYGFEFHIKILSVCLTWPNTGS